MYAQDPSQNLKKTLIQKHSTHQDSQNYGHTDHTDTFENLNQVQYNRSQPHCKIIIYLTLFAVGLCLVAALIFMFPLLISSTSEAVSDSVEVISESMSDALVEISEGLDSFFNATIGNIFTFSTTEIIALISSLTGTLADNQSSIAKLDTIVDLIEGIDNKLDFITTQIQGIQTQLNEIQYEIQDLSSEINQNFEELEAQTMLTSLVQHFSLLELLQNNMNYANLTTSATFEAISFNCGIDGIDCINSFRQLLTKNGFLSYCHAVFEAAQPKGYYANFAKSTDKYSLLLFLSYNNLQWLIARASIESISNTTSIISNDTFQDQTYVVQKNLMIKEYNNFLSNFEKIIVKLTNITGPSIEQRANNLTLFHFQLQPNAYINAVLFGEKEYYNKYSYTRYTNSTILNDYQDSFYGYYSLFPPSEFNILQNYSNLVICPQNSSFVGEQFRYNTTTPYLQYQIVCRKLLKAVDSCYNIQNQQGWYECQDGYYVSGWTIDRNDYSIPQQTVNCCKFPTNSHEEG